MFIGHHPPLLLEGIWHRKITSCFLFNYTNSISENKHMFNRNKHQQNKIWRCLFYVLLPYMLSNLFVFNLLPTITDNLLIEFCNTFLSIFYHPIHDRSRQQVFWNLFNNIKYQILCFTAKSVEKIFNSVWSFNFNFYNFSPRYKFCGDFRTVCPIYII